MNRGQRKVSRKVPLSTLLLKYAGEEDLIFKNNYGVILGYVNNENYFMINPRLLDYDKTITLYKSHKLSTRPNREGKEIIVITFDEVLD